MAGFLEEQHIVQVPLAVLTEWESLHCPRNEIYIVENPSIFAMLCGKEETDQKGKAYMCMNGQPRLAGLWALDLICKNRNPSLLCRRSGSSRCVDRTETFAVL